MKKYTTPSATNYKDIESSLTHLFRISCDTLVELRKPGHPLDRVIAKLQRTNVGFSLVFDDPTGLYSDLKDIENIFFISPHGSFFCERVLPIETNFVSVVAKLPGFSLSYLFHPVCFLQSLM